MIKRQETKRATTSASVYPLAQAVIQQDWVKKIEGQSGSTKLPLPVTSLTVSNPFQAILP